MIDDLLDELQAAGEVDSEGEFTMDRAKAREKLRRFQLADPRAYVLELVQAAALKGATVVRFEIDSRDMVMELDGRPFTTADFDDIYGAALTRRLDHDVLARRQLAIGLGSAMALRPRFIAVESGDGTTGARLRLRPDEEDEFEALQTARVGTRIHVRERFTMGTFAAFFKNLAGTLAEEQLLRARCGHASFTIDLEGTRIDRGLALEGDAVLDRVELENGHTRVRCGLRELGGGPPCVRIIKDGVWIADHDLPAERFPGCLVAIVQDHALRKDVSQSDIVRDAAYEAMLGVLEHGSRVALAALAGRVAEHTAPSWAEGELRRQLFALAKAGHVHDAAERSGLVRALRSLPLWTTTTGRPVCLDELFSEATASGAVAFTRRVIVPELVLPKHAFVLVLPTADASRPALERAILEHVFGSRLHDATGQLEAIARREQVRRAWRARPSAPALPEGAYLCRRTLEGPGVRGELGIVAEQTDRSSLVLVVDGCLLVEQPLPVPWLGLRMVVAAESLRPNDDFDGVVPTPEACTALLHAAAGIPALYGELAHAPASPWRDACAMSFLEAALRGDSLALVLGRRFERPGQADEGRAAAIEAFGASRLLLAPGLDASAPHPTVGMPLYRTLGPQRRSLHEIIARARRGEPIVAVAEPKPGVEAEILVLDDDDRALLQPLLARPIVDGSSEVARIDREREFMSHPAKQPELDARPPAVVVPIEGEGITGALQVIPRSGTGVRTIQVLHRQRPLDTMQLVMVGECKGWVESTDASPTVDFRYVKQDAALYRVRAAVLRAFAAACLKIAERCRGGATADETAFLLEVLGLPFPGAMRAAYDKLRQDQGATPQLCLEAHEQLYAELHVQRTPGFVEDRIKRLSQSKTPMADLRAKQASSRPLGWALAAIDVLFPPGAAPQDLAARVLRPVSPLAELPLLRHHDGRPLTLAEIRRVVEQGQALPYTQALASIEVPDRTIALADSVQLELLRRVVGSGRLLDGSILIEQVRRRQQLDALAKVERVGLAPGAALASIHLADACEPGLVGEVGLPARHPGDPHRRPRMRLAVHVERAPIEAIELDDRPVHIEAAVSDDRLLLSSDQKMVVRNEALHGLVAQCEAYVPALVVQLASRWDRLDPAARTVAWYHLLDFLVARRPPSHERWAQLRATEEAFAKAAAVPGFIGAGGVSLSAADLARAHQRHHRLEVLPAPHAMWGESPLPSHRPVVCADAYELAALRRLLPPVESVEASWVQWQARARNERGAPAARMLADDACLVWQDVVMQELQGRLAIPAAGDPLTIELCAEGKVIAARSLDGVLPCWGSVSGAWVQPDDRWTNALVDDEAVQALRLRSYKLYGKLARWLAAHEEHPEHARVASLLAEQVVALCRAERAGPLPDPQARLLDDLRWARVLPLANGRWITLHKALDERPGELAHLDLWAAPGHRLQRMYVEANPAVPAPKPSAPVVTEAKRTAAAPTPKPSAASTPAEPPRSPTPAPAPAPAPAPVPAPRVPTPEERLVDALRAELGLVRQRSERLLSNEHLDRIHVRPLSGGQRALVAHAGPEGVIVNREHLVVQRALAELQRDPVWCSYVASAVYTALNVYLAEITDADERTFLPHLAELVAGR